MTLAFVYMHIFLTVYKIQKVWTNNNENKPRLSKKKKKKKKKIKVKNKTLEKYFLLMNYFAKALKQKKYAIKNQMCNC